LADITATGSGLLYLGMKGFLNLAGSTSSGFSSDEMPTSPGSSFLLPAESTGECNPPEPGFV
jgi:hypothetical protein